MDIHYLPGLACWFMVNNGLYGNTINRERLNFTSLLSLTLREFDMDRMMDNIKESPFGSRLFSELEGSNLNLWDEVLGRIISRLLLHLGQRRVRRGGHPGEEHSGVRDAKSLSISLFFRILLSISICS